MKLVAGWNDGKTGPTCPVCYPCCGTVFYTPMGLGTETDAIVVSTVSQERADWKADQIALRVNNHERLVDYLRLIVDELNEKDPDGEIVDNTFTEGADTLLAAMEAEKGGEL